MFLGHCYVFSTLTWTKPFTCMIYPLFLHISKPRLTLARINLLPNLVFCFLNIVVRSLHWLGKNIFFLNIRANSDIFIEIFAHLPPREICNIISVSKSLESFTKNPDFVAKHLFSCKEIFNNLIGFYESFSIDDPRWNCGVVTTLTNP